MCGDSFHTIGYGVGSALDKYGSTFLDSSIIHLIKSHQIVIGNLECILSDIGRNDKVLRRIHMRGRPIFAEYLHQWGITCVNMANNHILEHGIMAAKDTVRNLALAGISNIGSGKRQEFGNGIGVTEISNGGIDFAILGICLCEDKYAYAGGGDFQQMLSSIREFKQKKKYIIVSIHWGDEWMNRPNRQQIQLASDLIRSGARLVIGHHPHVVQGISEMHNSLVAYSLGNFIFNSIHQDGTWSIILSVSIVDNQIVKWEYYPIRMDREFRPILETEAIRDQVMTEVSRRNRIIKEIASIEKYEINYQSELSEVRNITRRRLWAYLTLNFWKLPFIYWIQLILRPLQRWLKLW